MIDRMSLTGGLLFCGPINLKRPFTKPPSSYTEQVAHLMDTIAPAHHGRTKLKQHIQNHHVHPAAMGFPHDWDKRTVWQDVRP